MGVTAKSACLQQVKQLNNYADDMSCNIRNHTCYTSCAAGIQLIEGMACIIFMIKGLDEEDNVPQQQYYRLLQVKRNALVYQGYNRSGVGLDIVSGN